jgi:hypothetical protein
MSSNQRRKEDRIRSRGVIHLVVNDGRFIRATIHDISESGMSVESDVALAPELRIEVEGGGLLASAVVKHCAAHSAGFRIGLALIPVNML